MPTSSQKRAWESNSPFLSWIRQENWALGMSPREIDHAIEEAKKGRMSPTVQRCSLLHEAFEAGAMVGSRSNEA